MRKTRGQIGQRVMSGVVRIGRRGQRNPLTGMVPVLRPDPEVASRRAGARGVSAVGVKYVDRLTNYQEQNGPPYRLTPRQQRRLDHKAAHQEAKARRAIAARAARGGRA
ncbi:hypothetical protein [Micromonospora sp. 4G55]|uniref:hypothetical protein n=1 Tax=Micromonospora sp. 4G55 TaxID=2806102 RepID=UPI001A3D11BC|nr:hypothetical protein [Micromonospora sp. 4G55]MBM0256367.1 hypothetical protein [Micromonospora sp. 4G55]